MRALITLAIIALSAASASATCIGTGALSTCYDDSGNTYTIQRLGNSTYMQGHNARTGSNWSQDSHTFGNTTFHNGRDARGNSWNTTCTNGWCN